MATPEIHGGESSCFLVIRQSVFGVDDSMTTFQFRKRETEEPSSALQRWVGGESSCFPGYQAVCIWYRRLQLPAFQSRKTRDEELSPALQSWAGVKKNQSPFRDDRAFRTPLSPPAPQYCCVYSVRSAFTGLMDAARRAGMMLAINALSPRANIDPPSTSGSHPLT